MKVFTRRGALVILAGAVTIAVMGVAPSLNPTNDDVADVKREFYGHVEAAQAGDVDGYLRRHHPQMTRFDYGGGILKEFTSREEQRAEAVANIEGGLFSGLEVRDVHVKTFGGDTALMTFYLGITSPDGATTWTRRSELWVKENGQWMEAHGHWSGL